MHVTMWNKEKTEEKRPIKKNVLHNSIAVQRTLFDSGKKTEVIQQYIHTSNLVPWLS